MNTLYKYLRFMFTVGMFLLLMGRRSVSAEELYFNNQGDMIFSAYDKRASGGIRYRTMGWVIKRYEDSIGASGQYSVNLPMSGFFYEITDPSNPDYVYTTFVIASETILKRIADVSAEWRNQLYKYGGYVYVDSIMTVTEDGVPMGNIADDGTMYGEIYNTYGGIRNAREWADGDRLAVYFGLKVKYPALSGALEEITTITAILDKTYSVQAENEAGFGSLRPGEERYDVARGIPSGESVYLSGKVQKFMYDISVQEISGVVNIPVKVGTVYHLKWYDTSGNLCEEDQVVERWYYVTKPFSYTKVTGAKKYDLQSIKIKNNCISEITVSPENDTGGITVKNYGNAQKHMATTKGCTASAGIVTVQSMNNQRPDIPEQDQSGLAQSALAAVHVWSDKVLVNEKVLLSDDRYIENADTVGTYGSVPVQELYREGIVIDQYAGNGEYDGKLSVVYRASDGSEKTINTGTNIIKVHTPVAAALKVSGDKTNNENIVPQSNDVVAGERFLVSISAKGKHREIMGYGEKNYAVYADNYYVKFPFAVNYRTKSYPADTWIRMTESMGKFQMLSYVSEGKYEVKCRVTAVNLPETEEIESLSQEKANFELSKYCATDSVEINVIGKIYGFTLQNGPALYRTGTAAVLPQPFEDQGYYLPAELSFEKRPEKGMQIGIYTTGIGDEADELIEADVSYSIMDQQEDESMWKEVDLYSATDEKFSAADLQKLPEKIVLSASDCRCIRPGVYRYTTDFELPANLVVVEKGRDISDISMLSDYILRDKTILIHFDLYAADKGGRKLSYENAQNEKYGYCNMWKKEKFSVDKYEDVPLRCGDIIIYEVNGMLKNTSKVYGTH